MLNLPDRTLRSISLPKKAIYEKFSLSASEKVSFDADISRMHIAAELSPATLSVEEGAEILTIFVVHIALKKEAYNDRNILLLTKLVQQKMVLVLEYEDKVKLAVHHSRLHSTQWKQKDEAVLELNGLNLDKIWEGIVTQIGDFTLAYGNTLSEQVQQNEQSRKLEKQIATLEKAARAEKQPRKKYELVQQIKALTAQLQANYK